MPVKRAAVGKSLSMTHTSTLSAPHPDRLKEFSKAAELSPTATGRALEMAPELAPGDSTTRCDSALPTASLLPGQHHVPSHPSSSSRLMEAFVASLTVEKMPSRIDCERSCSLGVAEATRLLAAARHVSAKQPRYVISARVPVFLATGNRRRKRGLHSGRTRHDRLTKRNPINLDCAMRSFSRLARLAR